MSYRYTPGDRDYFRPPHGGRPPSDEAVHAATQRYIAAEEAERIERERLDTDRRSANIAAARERMSRFPAGYSPGAQPAAPERGGKRDRR